MFVGLGRFHKLTAATTHAPKKETWLVEHGMPHVLHALMSDTYLYYTLQSNNMKWSSNYCFDKRKLCISLSVGRIWSWPWLFYLSNERKKQWLTRYHVYEARFNPTWNDVPVSVTITLFYLHQQNAATIIQDLFNDLNKRINPQLVNEKVYYR